MTRQIYETCKMQGSSPECGYVTAQEAKFSEAELSNRNNDVSNDKQAPKLKRKEKHGGKPLEEGPRSYHFGLLEMGLHKLALHSPWLFNVVSLAISSKPPFVAHGAKISLFCNGYTRVGPSSIVIHLAVILAA